MSSDESLMEKFRQLPPDKQQAAMDLVEYLHEKSARRGPRRSVKGRCGDGKSPVTGSSWRVLVRGLKNPDKLVHALEGDGSSWFDELVVGDWLHLEHMHDDSWWMRLGDAYIWITAPDGRPPEIDIRRGEYYPQPYERHDAKPLTEADIDDDTSEKQ